MKGQTAMEIVSIIGTGFVTLLTSILLFVFKQEYTCNRQIQSALKNVLRSEIRNLHDEYMEPHFITADEAGDFEDLYQTYAALGGNGRGHLWYEEVMEKVRNQHD